MFERISALALPVSRVFSSDFRFSLPYFQRGYAWQIEHAGRLLRDIALHADRQGEIDWYPLGQIIVSRAHEDAVTLVADGHQRLITLTIMLAILRDLESDPELKHRLARCISAPPMAGKSSVFHLSTQTAASLALRDYVQRDGATAHPGPDDADLTDSEANILANRDHLSLQLGTLDAAARRVIARFLLDRCMLVVTVLDDEKAASLMFSTMHDTGLRPSSSDLFKARVLGNIEPDERDTCQSIWESREAALGEDSFAKLFHHMAFIAGGPLQRRAFNAVLDHHYRLDNPGEARIFVEQHLQRYGRCLEAISLASPASGSLPAAIRRRLQFFSWIRAHETWIAPLIEWLATSGFEHARTPAFLRRLEALAWCETIMATEPPYRDARYTRLIAAIRKGNALDPGSPLDVTKAEQNEIRAKLSAPNFTRRRYRMFLLLRINATLEASDAIAQLPEATIEHVFPRSPAKSSKWIGDFGQGKQSKRLRDELGNLTLLTEAEQTKTQNYDFTIKRAVLATSTFALSRNLAEQALWGPDEIRANTQRRIDLLFRDWGIAGE